jgi:very-short-patch-repair endonuclease
MKRRIIPYNIQLKEKARKLRNNSTFSEVLLWNKLKKAKDGWGYDFHRQKPLLNYIVDFYCAELQLIIEIDGNYHNTGEQFDKDQQRQKELEEYDLHFLRFTEAEVRKQMDGVIRRISIYIEDYEKHTPNPSQEGN